MAASPQCWSSAPDSIRSSPAENVYLNGQVLGLTRRELDQRFDSIAAFADIGTFLDQPVKMYSSGMAVRLAFAVMAHVDADILVIDEALAVGDALFTQKCMRFLRAFRESGTLLFVSHDTGAVINSPARAVADQGRRGRLGQRTSATPTSSSRSSRCRAIGGTGAAPDPAGAKGSRGGPAAALHHIPPLRNDLELKPFDPSVASFGKGGASVTDVALEDEAGNRLAWVVGGETVTLTIRAVADRELRGAIIGFFVRDRLGQNLFGDNTVLASADEPLRVAPGEAIEARFVFDMPVLPIGDYSINVAIAEGNQAEHVAHQWIHDALIFKSHASSVTHSLIGIPMREIAIGLAAAEDLKEQSNEAIGVRRVREGEHRATGQWMYEFDLGDGSAPVYRRAEASPRRSSRHDLRFPDAARFDYAAGTVLDIACNRGYSCSRCPKRRPARHRHRGPGGEPRESRVRQGTPGACELRVPPSRRARRRLRGRAAGRGVPARHRLPRREPDRPDPEGRGRDPAVPVRRDAALPAAGHDSLRLGRPRPIPSGGELLRPDRRARRQSTVGDGRPLPIPNLAAVTTVMRHCGFRSIVQLHPGATVREPQYDAVDRVVLVGCK
jgi:lipopolysaccharide transport system ATP-binding protein